MTSATTSERLLQLAQTRRDCLLRVSRYGAGQIALIEQGDMGRLLTLLAEKSRELETLTQVDEQLKPFRDLPLKSHDWSSEQDRADCRKLLDESEAIMKEILAQEKESETKLAARRTDVSQQLQTLQGANQASTAYANNAPVGGHRLDLSTGS
ncbi:MAG: hypothetical protein MPJ50_10240 [Pirellulales bacterium]|nr:hypothetical protein [Pirellulales bacterium]